jgi:hypothetical protein
MGADDSGAWKMEVVAAEEATPWDGSSEFMAKGGAKRLKRFFSEGGVAFNGDHNANATCKSGTDQSWICCESTSASLGKPRTTYSPDDGAECTSPPGDRRDEFKGDDAGGALKLLVMGGVEGLAKKA